MASAVRATTGNVDPAALAGADPAHGLDAVHHRHVDVHQHDVEVLDPQPGQA
jgi:hypothetical protein